MLALADGSTFRGQSIGATGNTSGEVVFNTALTGYQEILSDPSYSRQIVTLTYPHIGNVGTNDDDMESVAAYAAGLVIRDLPPRFSNYRSTRSLPDFLVHHGVVAIADIDTRRLTRILREKGAQNGAIVTGEASKAGDVAKLEAAALEAARAFPGLKGMDIAKIVSVRERYEWIAGSTFDAPPARTGHKPYRVVAFDFGVKHNILRLLVDAGCSVTVVPAQTPASEVLALNPEGVFLSNGPGDPEALDYASETARQLIGKKPLFGICLGHQILARALGGKTFKLKFGHRGANQPVKDLRTGRIAITSQNHGYAVDPASLPSDVEVTHINLNDGTVAGLRHSKHQAFSVQYHPEASPGPHDADYFFAEFAKEVAASKSQS